MHNNSRFYKFRWLLFIILILNSVVINAATSNVSVDCTNGFDLNGGNTFVLSSTASKSIAVGDILNITFSNCSLSSNAALFGQEPGVYTEDCGNYSTTPPTSPLASSFSVTYTAGSSPAGGRTAAYCASGAAPNGDHIQYQGAFSLQLTIFVTGMDNIAPSLNSSTPTNNGTDIALDSDIVLNFDENVVVENGNITIKKTSDNTTVETIDVTSGLVTGSGTSTITIDPAVDLVGSTKYYILIDATAFDDISANSYSGISNITALSFTTIDTTNPSLSSSAPTNNAPNVAFDSSIVLNFNENVVVASGNIIIKKTSDNTTVETIDVTSGLVTGSGTSAITIDPANNLAGQTQYYILIDATAFEDTSANSYLGISNTNVLSFTTSDIDNPSLNSSAPTDNVVGVTLDANIILNFNENVVVENGNITIKKTRDNTTVETIDVTSALVTGTGTSAITINPAADLIIGTEYYVLIASTAFDDTSTNSYAGISSTTALSFTTSLPNPFDDSEIVNLIQAQTNSVINIANQAIRPVNNRLSHLLSAPRDSLANNSHQGIQLSINSGPNINTAISNTGLLSGLNASGDIFDNGWAVWTEGSIVLGKREGGSDFQVSGITVGVDKRITPYLTTGLALRVAREDDDVGATTTTNTDSYSATAYGSFAIASNSYIQAALGYSDIDITSKRQNNNVELVGNRHAEQIYMSLSFTHRYDYLGFILLPYASFDGSYSTLDNYSESGSDFALTYHQQNVKSLSSTLGLRANYFIEQSYGLFVPRLHINYQGDIKSDSDATINYLNIPSTNFTRTFDGNASASWLVGLGLDYNYQNLVFRADYERTQHINWGHSDSFRLMVNATF